MGALSSSSGSSFWGSSRSWCGESPGGGDADLGSSRTRANIGTLLAVTPTGFGQRVAVILGLGLSTFQQIAQR